MARPRARKSDRNYRAGLKAGITIVAAALLLWLVTIVTVGGIFRTSDPVRALKWVSFDARAQGALSTRLIDGDAKDLKARAQARTLAAQSLTRSPTSVEAIRALGLIADVDGDQRRARRLFLAAQALSRRDVPTQLWIIDWNMRRGSVEEALNHFDIAMRISRRVGPALFPVLIQASGDPGLARRLNGLLRQKPSWWLPFSAQLVAETKNPQTLPQVLQNVLDPALEDERQIITALMGRLVAEGEFDRAWSTYLNFREKQPEGEFVRNGNFEGEIEFPPFDWELAGEADLAAQPGPKPNAIGDSALYLVATGKGGEVAKQLLRLQPGSYQLTAQVGDVPTDTLNRPAIALRCAGKGDEMRANAAFPAALPGGRAMKMTFAIPPSGCPYQWLVLSVRGGLDRPESSPWIDRISLGKT